MNTKKFLYLVFGTSLLTAFSPVKADWLDKGLITVAIGSYGYAAKCVASGLASLGSLIKYSNHNADPFAPKGILDNPEGHEKETLVFFVNEYKENGKKIKRLANNVDRCLIHGLCSLLVGTSSLCVLAIKLDLENQANVSDDF